MALAPGTPLGPYEILSLLGAGGMGEVYRARDPRLGRDVALKVLPAALTGNADRLRRFEREARATAALNHPNILAVYDVGTHDATPYVVSELLEGHTLRHALLAGAPPLRRAIDWAAQAATGLAAAHEKGIVHRDLKPENIFITSDGRAKILDFGIAKLIEPRDGATTIIATQSTAAGVIVGTAGYMSPEHVSGDATDSRSDIFSFGAVLYELVSGKRAFSGTTRQETLRAVVTDDPPDLTGLPNIPVGLQAVIVHCLEKDPALRFQSARDLAFALRSFAIPGTGPSDSIQRPTAPPRRARGLALAAIGAMLAASMVWLGVTRWRRPPAPAVATFTQLTFDSGVEAFPSLSPDGSWVVYAGASSGRTDIYLRSVGGQSAINLTKASLENSTQPVLSPDGQQIAFRSERDGGGLFVMTRTGESPRRLTTAGFNPAWSPDGSQIVYATESTEARPEFRSENNSQIVVATLDTGATRTLPTGDAVQPSWSPHGWRVAYWGLWNRNQRDIWTIAVGGGSPVRVTSDAAIDWNPVWSIDGRWLYFCSDRSGTMNLWRVRIDEQTGATSGPPEAIVVPAPWVGQVALARDGTHLAYASYQRASNVYRVAFDPVRETLADRVDTVTRGSNQWQVSDMSRDGQSLAMTAATAGGQHVLVSDANGSSMRQLTFGAWLDVAPTWSPDGVTLGFFSNRSGRYQVWSVKQDGSELRQLTDVPDEGVFGPTWSPDGKRFTACAPVTFKCFMFEIAGGVTTMVAALPEPPDRQVQFDAYDWSSDGNWLAGGDFGVMVYSLRDKAYQRLTSVGREPQWLADGRRLVYLANGRLTLIDRLTGRSRDLSGSLHTDMRNMFLAHDGRSIYFTDLGLESDIWLMTLHD